MNEEELKNACSERGMPSVGLSVQVYRRNLENWLALSLNKEVPASLLILSRAFTMSQKLSTETDVPAKTEEEAQKKEEEAQAAAMAATLSSLDEQVVQDVEVEIGGQDRLKKLQGEWKRTCVCVYVCVCERERERERE